MDKGSGRRRPARIRKIGEGRAPVRTRSFACPDDLWSEVEAFSKERGLGTPSVAARVLLRSGLSVEQRSRELQAARDWQIAQAWAEVKAIEEGRSRVVGWSEIDRVFERARRKIRRREAARTKTRRT